MSSRFGNLDVAVGRLVPYWLTVLATGWILAYMYMWNSYPGREAFEEGVVVPIFGTVEAYDWWAGNLIGFVSPYVVFSCVCALLLTNHALPANRLGWLQKMVSSVRQHPTTPFEEGASSAWTKFWSTVRVPGMRDATHGRDLSRRNVNQFGKGEADFNAMAFWLIALPVSMMMVVLKSWYSEIDVYAEEIGVEPMQLKVEWASYLFGWISTLCLIFFLIPVTRHSVLLAAMGWSPIHALRIHIWAGHLAFWTMLIHGIMLVPVWFIFYEYPIYQQIIPMPGCWTWTWNDENYDEIKPNCGHVFYNWTGIVAGVFFIVLYGSSLNWVRRRNYKWFYLLHVSFGTLTLLGIVLHMKFFLVYLIPSLTCYLTSTTPTIIQALASRFRGGVKIRQVTLVDDSGGCVEVLLDTHATTHAEADREPCQFVKVCVPKISVVWHPFDTYKSYGGRSDSVRFMFRPVGPFTKRMAECLTVSAPEQRPVVLVDGFYRGSSKVEQALTHDCVTMVAGGIAITPYLTFLPVLVRTLGGQEEANVRTLKTQSVVLHWVVREAGLCAFMMRNYLEPILQSARTTFREDMKFSIHVYITGGGKMTKIQDLSELKAAATTFKEKGEKTDSGEEEGVTGSEELESGGSSSSGHSLPKEEDTKKEAMVVTTQGYTHSSKGHALELARMLPRRYASFVWNVPFFVAYTGAMFLGFWWFFNAQMTGWYSYYALSSPTWYVIYGILMYVAFGLLVEAVVLGCRKVWPQPRLDDFAVVVNGKSGGGGGVSKMVSSSSAEVNSSEGSDLDAALDPADASYYPNVTLTYHEGRPSMTEVFAEARLATEPGIFMCGPTPLTTLVKKEAAKENSYMGLTRYCLYDEPYEM